MNSVKNRIKEERKGKGKEREAASTAGLRS
jgi:hypothetical protein